MAGSAVAAMAEADAADAAGAEAEAKEAKEARGRRSTQRLREALTCAVCLDTMRCPVASDCGHCLCLKCARAMDERSRPEASARCPVCKAECLRPWFARPHIFALRDVAELVSPRSAEKSADCSLDCRRRPAAEEGPACGVADEQGAEEEGLPPAPDDCLADFTRRRRAAAVEDCVASVRRALRRNMALRAPRLEVRVELEGGAWWLHPDLERAAGAAFGLRRGAVTMHRGRTEEDEWDPSHGTSARGSVDLWIDLSVRSRAGV